MWKKLLFTGAALSLTASPGFAEVGDQETVRIWQIDTSGRPPFERRRVEVPVADLARFEQVQVTETVTRRVADFRGRPPFRRSVQEVPLIDAASLETGLTDKAHSPTPRPFHKLRHR